MYCLSMFPYVHIWKNQSEVLFYNIANNIQTRFLLDEESAFLVDRLLDVRNLYCISLTERQRNLPIVEELIAKQLGVVVSCAYEDRPTTIPPMHLLENRYDDGKESNSVHVLDLVRMLTIHLERGCNRFCTNCLILFKQTHYCTRAQYQGTAFNAQRIVSKVLKMKSLTKINLLITVVDQSVLDFIRVLSLTGTLLCYYIDWKNVSYEIIASLHDANKSALIKVLINLAEVSSSEFEQLIELQSTFKESTILVVGISSEAELNRINTFLARNPEQSNIELFPFWSGGDCKLIHSHYLLSDKELQTISVDQNRIYGNRELNFALFGELVVHPDGTVRLNENTEVIGSIEDDWTEMLNKALNKPNPWLMTRGKTKPCSNCIYRDLCPPIRNLELYMGDKLACVDYYKTLPKQDTAN